MDENVESIDPNTDWDLLHETFKTGNKDQKFASLLGGVKEAIALAEKHGCNPSILKELEMQLLDKEMGSKSTYLDWKMPTDEKKIRRKAVKPSRDLKATFAVAAVKAFRKSGLTEASAIEKVSEVSGYEFERIENWYDYYHQTKNKSEGYSYLKFRIKELDTTNSSDAAKLATTWAELSVGL